MRLQVQGIHSFSSMDICWIDDRETISSQPLPSDTASSFYGETSRVQPDRAGFSGIAKAVAESE
jgi:hypothetical protein